MEAEQGRGARGGAPRGPSGGMLGSGLWHTRNGAAAGRRREMTRSSCRGGNGGERHQGGCTFKGYGPPEFGSLSLPPPALCRYKLHKALHCISPLLPPFPLLSPFPAGMRCTRRSTGSPPLAARPTSTPCSASTRSCTTYGQGCTDTEQSSWTGQVHTLHQQC